jgi:hypothetical protein
MYPLPALLSCSLHATLVFDMPPGYPAAAAMRCHVTSSHLPRDVSDTLSQQLQQQAEALQVGLTAAAAAGRSRDTDWYGINMLYTYYSVPLGTIKPSEPGRSAVQQSCTRLPWIEQEHASGKWELH